ncbi:2-amino-4-hydroxy-6-hydroxymethyldihydropteridine diphosphokinase, partial [Candidatus Pelagibacter bacterium]|nr:2-amino-4-hydroxy-6-hydroxymethyldihydropteridine diphosphokinase [Candidatus Pelagibacter bacterium]
IEKKFGRIRSKKNDPRACDIDIIDFNGLIIENDNLKIPHEKCHLRNFVLYPILQIDSEWVHPIIRKNVKFLINNLDQKSRIDITRLNKNVIIER